MNDADLKNAVLPLLQLSWWRIRDPDASKEKAKERAGWLGMTVTNFNDAERKAIIDWANTHPMNVLLSSKHEFEGEYALYQLIGDHVDYCVGVWCSSEELRLELIGLLESFPKRTTIIVAKNINRIEQFIEGTNSKILSGENGHALGLTEEIDSETLTLIKLAG